MSVLTRPNEPTHRLPGAEFTALATPSTGSPDTAVWEVNLSPSHEATPHSLTHSEVFVVLEGSARVTIADEAVDLGVGDCLVVPRQTQFSLQATGTGFRALCCMPTDGKAITDGSLPFTPPWAE